MAAEGSSRHPDARTAGLEVAEQLEAAGAAGSAIVVAFASFHHTQAMPEVMESLRAVLKPERLLAATASSIAVGDAELEGSPAIAAVAFRLPEVTSRPIRILADDGPPESWSEATLHRHFGFADDGTPPAGILLFTDPFGPAPAALLARLGRVAGGPPPLVGGIATGSSQFGGQVLCIDGHLERTGAVGLSLHGRVAFDWIVSSAARAIGAPAVVTSSKGSTLKTLGGRPAIEVAQRACEDLDERSSTLIERGLFVGVANDESAERPEQGGYLLHPVVSANPKRGELLLAESIRPGRTVRFHLRDPESGNDDLDLALDQAQLRPKPAVAIAAISSARGKTLFGSAGHDAAAIQRRVGPMPLVGAATAGELAPRGGTNRPHSLTVAAALVRPS